MKDYAFQRNNPTKGKEYNICNVNGRISSLEGFRWVAFILIFLSHLTFMNDYPYSNIWNAYLDNPTLGVDYFFVLSGFGIYYSASRKGYSWHSKSSGIHSFKSSVRFAIHKVQKIYPFYIFMLIVTVPYSILMDLTDADLKKASIKALLKFIGCSTLLQSAFGSTYLSHALVATSWFLSTLFICYTACPYIVNRLMRLDRKYNLGALITLIFVAFLFGKFCLFIEQITLKQGVRYINDLYYGSPYSRIWYLMIGMTIAKGYVDFTWREIGRSAAYAISGGSGTVVFCKKQIMYSTGI